MTKIFYLKHSKDQPRKQVAKTEDRLVEVSYFSDKDALLNALSNESCDIIVVDEKRNTENFNYVCQFLDQEIFFMLNEKNEFNILNSLELFEKYKLEKHQAETESIVNRLVMIESYTNVSVRNDLVNMFYSKQDWYLTFLFEQKNNRDFKKLKFEIHNLKSTAANIGAIKLPYICNLIEVADDTISDTKIKILLQAAITEIKKINSFLLQDYL